MSNSHSYGILAANDEHIFYQWYLSGLVRERLIIIIFWGVSTYSVVESLIWALVHSHMMLCLKQKPHSQFVGLKNGEGVSNLELHKWTTSKLSASSLSTQNRGVISWLLDLQGNIWGGPPAPAMNIFLSRLSFALGIVMLIVNDDHDDDGVVVTGNEYNCDY